MKHNDVITQKLAKMVGHGFPRHDIIPTIEDGVIFFKRKETGAVLYSCTVDGKVYYPNRLTHKFKENRVFGKWSKKKREAKATVLPAAEYFQNAYDSVAGEAGDIGWKPVALSTFKQQYSEVVAAELKPGDELILINVLQGTVGDEPLVTSIAFVAFSGWDGTRAVVTDEDGGHETADLNLLVRAVMLKA